MKTPSGERNLKIAQWTQILKNDKIGKNLSIVQIFPRCGRYSSKATDMWRREPKIGYIGKTTIWDFENDNVT